MTDKYQLTLEEVKVVVSREASTPESVPQSSGSWEEDLGVERPFYQINT